LTPNQRLLKLTIEGSLKENSKGRKTSTDLAQPVDGKINNQF